MKRILYITIVLAITWMVVYAESSIDFALYGQSNASADVRFGETPDDPPAEAWFNGWLPAIGNVGAATPPGIGQLGRALTYLFSPENTVRWVTGPVNGASISQLVPGTTAYATFLGRIVNSQATPKCLIYWQGESDPNTSINDFQAGLQSIWDDLQLTTLESMFIVKPSPMACGNDMTNVRTAIDLFKVANPNVYRVGIDHILIGPDGCHYTGNGYDRVAREISKAIQANHVNCRN